MTPEHAVPGDSLFDQAVRLSGALAEEGVRSVILRPTQGPPRDLGARSTDLPGEIERLARAGGGTIECPLATIMVTDRSLRILAPGHAAALRLLRAIAGP